MGRIYRRATARRDLVEHFVFLAETAGQETAERFLESARASFEDLAAQPLIGAPVKLSSPALAGLRKWPVREFKNYIDLLSAASRRDLGRAARLAGLV